MRRGTAADAPTISGLHALLLAEVMADNEQERQAFLDALARIGEGSFPDLHATQARVPMATLKVILGDRFNLEQAVAVGRRLRLTTQGALGHAVMTAPTVGVGIEMLAQYISVLTNVLSFGITVENDISWLTIQPQSRDQDIDAFIVMAVVTALGELAVTATGQMAPVRVELAFDLPRLPDALAAFAAGHVRTGCSHSRLGVPHSWRETPMLMADPLASQAALLQCSEVLQKEQECTGIAGKVRALLVASPLGFPGLQEVAANLHMSESTLKRQLAREDKPYHVLLEEVRRERALQLLRNPGLTQEQIAERLGYANVANFGTAFKRWTGTTPGAFRRR